MFYILKTIFQNFYYLVIWIHQFLRSKMCDVLHWVSFLAMPSAIFSVATSVELRQVMCDYDLYPFYCPIIADKIYLH